MPNFDQRLTELGIVLAEPRAPRWAYAASVRSGNLLFVSGQGAIVDGKILHPGKLGRDVTVEQGVEAARQCAISALAIVRQSLGTLDAVARVVKLTAFVA